MPGRRPSIKHKKPAFSGRTLFLDESGKYRRVLKNAEGTRSQSTQEDPMMAWKLSWETSLKKTKGKP